MINVNEYKKKDVIKREEEAEVEIREFDFEVDIDFDKYDKTINWEYKNKLATMLPIKSTVSKIKEMKNEDIEFFDLNNKEIGIAEIIPEFMKEEEKITGARRGTLMHLFLQKLDLKKQYTQEQLEELKEELIAKNLINKDEAQYINIGKIMLFLKSELARKIMNAKTIEKEKAFCMKIDAKEVFKDLKKELNLKPENKIYNFEVHM